MNNQTTYALLVRSAERTRDTLEAAIYGLCILSAVVAIWQFARQPLPLAVTLPVASQLVDPQGDRQCRA
jgi:hypothetical protein